MYTHAKLMRNLFCSAISTVSTCKNQVCAQNMVALVVAALSFSFLGVYVTAWLSQFIYCQRLWVLLGRDSKSTLLLPSF